MSYDATVRLSTKIFPVTTMVSRICPATSLILPGNTKPRRTRVDQLLLSGIPSLFRSYFFLDLEDLTCT